MAGTRITQLHLSALSGRTYGSFADRVEAEPAPAAAPQSLTVGGGGGFLSRGKGRKLFDDIERTLRETIEGPQPVLHIGTAAAVDVNTNEALDRALDQLVLLAREGEELSARLAKIKRDVAAYQARKRKEIEDDDAEFWLLA